MIASGQHGYCFTLAGNVFTADPANLVTPLQVFYVDGFFLAIIAGSNQWQYSNALDGTTWNALNKTAVSVFPDALQGGNFDHREFIVFGSERGVAYYDSGNLFAFDVVPGGYIDDGLAASFAICRADNTTFYLGFDERGNIALKRLNGYTPSRVSTHAVEQTWRSYTKFSDATMCAIGWNGHTFVQITFPSANNGRGATWWYDVGSSPDMAWSDQFYWQNGLEWAHKGTYHTVAFGGKHLVLDANSGNVYLMDDQFTTDDGAPIRRIRRCPHLSNEGTYLKLTKIELAIEPGLASIVGGGSPTTITLASPNGSLWAVQVSDAGILQVNPTLVGTAQTIVLNDTANGTSWLLGVSNGGILTTTAQTLNVANATFYQLIGTGGTKIYYLQVSNAGILSTNDEGNFFRAPQHCLRISRDGGKTYGNEHWRGAGLQGEYRNRSIWRQMGAGRDIVLEFTDSDPWPSRLIDLWVNEPVQRLAEKLRAQA